MNAASACTATEPGGGVAQPGASVAAGALLTKSRNSAVSIRSLHSCVWSSAALN